MPLYKNYPVANRTVFTNDSQGGTPAGKTSNIVSTPIRGRLMKVAATFTSSVSSVATLAIVKWNANGSTAALSSTAVGTAAIPLGVAAIIDIPNAVYVDEGDGIQFVCSGGPTSAAAATYYAIIRP